MLCRTRHIQLTRSYLTSGTSHTAVSWQPTQLPGPGKPSSGQQHHVLTMYLGIVILFQDCLTPPALLLWLLGSEQHTQNEDEQYNVLGSSSWLVFCFVTDSALFEYV